MLCGCRAGEPFPLVPHDVKMVFLTFFVLFIALLFRLVRDDVRMNAFIRSLTHSLTCFRFCRVVCACVSFLQTFDTGKGPHSQSAVLPLPPMYVREVRERLCLCLLHSNEQISRLRSYSSITYV